jgi:hypothetical protein
MMHGQKNIKLCFQLSTYICVSLWLLRKCQLLVSLAVSPLSELCNKSCL